MQARDVARAYAAGRVALGGALVVAPRLLGGIWLGAPARTPGGAVAIRALGAREVVIGGIALHTVDHPDVAPRWQRTCAALDAFDLAATAAARDRLPRAGSALVMAMAATGAAIGGWLGSALSRPAP
jgi:hypothetical protein